jgi:hypothetical protein
MMQTIEKPAADVPRNYNGTPLDATYFWQCFDDAVTDLYSGAQMEAQAARRLLGHLTPSAVEAAIRRGVVDATPPDHGSLPALCKRVKAVGAEAFGAEAGGDTDDAALLREFAALQLTVARCERVMRDWAAWYWCGCGDAAALDWANPETRADFARRFAALMDAEHIYRTDWEASGLSLDDLLEDEADG